MPTRPWARDGLMIEPDVPVPTTSIDSGAARRDAVARQGPEGGGEAARARAPRGVDTRPRLLGADAEHRRRRGARRARAGRRAARVLVGVERVHDLAGQVGEARRLVAEA